MSDPRHFLSSVPGARPVLCALALLISGHGLAQEPGQRPLWLQNPWTGSTRLIQVTPPDTSLWNGARIADHAQAMKQEGPPPLALLTIESLGLRVPVYNGTDESTLDRGLGRILGMARMDERGHLGISGHRDGFFRALKDLQAGDQILLESTTQTETFVVEDFQIVDKNDASVLREPHEHLLTLVTCYPFYHVGSAPQRYIVHARPVRDAR